MATDPFDALLTLENDFYKEGFDAGIADSVYAGLVEGKLFGIEKGFEKALEIGKAHGRAQVWQQRLDGDALAPTLESPSSGDHLTSSSVCKGSELDLGSITKDLPALPTNARLKKHIQALVSLTDLENLAKDNSDESISELDDRIVKIGGRMKMISKMVNEPVALSSGPTTGIEDSTGLSARH